MKLSRLVLSATILILHIPLTAQPVSSPQAQAVGQTRKPNFSTPDQIKEHVNAVPCKGNPERLKAVKALFEKMGAPAADISIEKTDYTETSLSESQVVRPD